MRLTVAGILLCLGLYGCASSPAPSSESENYGVKDGVLWVRGPWSDVKSSKDIDEVIDQICPAVVRLPAAAARDYGQEYCGVVYSLEDGRYYASYPSPLGKTVLLFVDRRKQCLVPRVVVDLRGQPNYTADFHSHPWAGSLMSQTDRRANTQVYSIRIQFDTECRVLKLIPYKNENRPGEVYLRDNKNWKLIGHIKGEDKAEGLMTPVGE